MPINIGILGLGTVGCGVVRILQQNAEDIETRTHCKIQIKAILARDLQREREVRGDFLITDQPEEILQDPEIDIIVEVMGGIEPARTYILEALRNGKSVVTANKDLLALHGHELLDAANMAGKDLYFEASVAGGIPIIAALKESLAANRITEVIGIINGTTNYILTAMAEQGREYLEVLAEAQKLGYAEADPSADVDGLEGMLSVIVGPPREILLLPLQASRRAPPVGEVVASVLVRSQREGLQSLAKNVESKSLVGEQ